MKPTPDDARDHGFLDALAGRVAPGADAATVAEARLLRAALREQAREREGAGDVAPVDTAALLQQLHHLRGAAPACPGCQRRWQLLRGWFTPGRTAGGLATLALAGLALVAVLPRAPAPEDTAQPLRDAGPGRTWLVADAQPRDHRDALAQQLLAAGAQVRRYERVGRWGIDAELAQPLPPALAAQLAGLGITAPAAGPLRIEFEPRTP